MESDKTNEEELTSTMGNLLSTTKDDSASDSTPTSSTDASTTMSTSQIAADDPISSTSSDVLESKKCTEKVACSIIVMDSLKNIRDHSSPIVSEKDLLDMNITDTSTEKITENVDDIVQDLENLLGEPTTSFSFSIKAKVSSRNSSTQNKDISADLDEFSAELQMLSEQSTGLKEIPKNPPNVNPPEEAYVTKPTDIANEEPNSRTTLDSKTSIAEQTVLENVLDQTETENSQCREISDVETNAVEKINDDVISESNTKMELLSTEKIQEPETQDNISSTESKVEDLKSTSENISVVEETETETEEMKCRGDLINLEETQNVEDKAPNLIEADTKEKVNDSNQKNLEEDNTVVAVVNVEEKPSEGIEEDPEENINQEEIENNEDKKTTMKLTETVDESKRVEEIQDSSCNQTHTEEISVSIDVTKPIETVEITENIDSESSVYRDSKINTENPKNEETPEMSIEEIKNEDTPTLNSDSVIPETMEVESDQVNAAVNIKITEEVEQSVQENKIDEILENQPEEVKVTQENKIDEILENQPEEVKVTQDDSDKKMDSETSLVEEIREVLDAEQDNSDKKPKSITLLIEDVQNQPMVNNGDEKSEVGEQLLSPKKSEDTQSFLILPTNETEESRNYDDKQLIMLDNQTSEEVQISLEITKESNEVEELTNSNQNPLLLNNNQSSEESVQVQPPSEIETIKEAEPPPPVSEEILEIIREPSLDLQNETRECDKMLLSDCTNLQVDVAPSMEVPSTQSPRNDEFQPFESTQQITASEEVKLLPIESDNDTNIPVENVNVESNLETTPTVEQINFISSDLDLPTRSLTHRLDLLVHDTVSEQATPPEKQTEGNSQVPTLKNLEGVMDNNILPLEMEDVPDLEVLNAISTLSDNKSNLVVQEIGENVQESDALLTTSSLERSSNDEVPFESNVEETLPTVDEIFAEPNHQQQQDDLQDDNLETLLAVASLQNVDYNMPVEDFTPSVESGAGLEEIPGFTQVEGVPKTIKGDETKLEEEKHVDQKQENKLNEPLVINVDDGEKERVYSPKITIKPIKPPQGDEESTFNISADTESKGSLKMTITKQSDNTHSILKIYNPDDDNTQHDADQPVPKLIIKPIVQPNEQPQSPKITRSSKQVFSPNSSNQRSASPRITIKPIPKPEEAVAPLKITIKPVLKGDECHKQKHSPKLTIKPIIKPEEEIEPKLHSPRVTIKPIVKPSEEEQISNPRITIKPIVKPVETVTDSTPITPRVTIKPVVKPLEKDKCPEMIEQLERSSPKITIKPIVKPQEPEPIHIEDYEDSIKERIVLKINKGNIPGSSKKRELPLEEERSEKLTKIKLKFSKEGGHPQIVQDQSSNKRSAEGDNEKNKRQRIETEHFLPGVTITPIGPSTHSKLKEMLSRNDNTEKVVTIEDDDDDVTIVEEPNKSSPIVISEESNQDSMVGVAEIRDPISEIPVFEITPESVKTLNPQQAPPVVEIPVTLPAPRKRGRPRKVPLQVREDFKDPKEEEVKPVVVESTRPKRSCRGQSVRATLGIKPRKPRGPGRGRGGKRGMGTRNTPTPTPPPISTPPPPEISPKSTTKEPKLGGTKLKELKEDSFLLSDKSEIDDGFQKSSPSNSLLAPPPQTEPSTSDRADIVMYEEETRMSAETSSRAQTPAKQVISTIPTVDLVEESQSSVQSIQSTATTESVKVRKGPRLEVHQEPEGAVISADQLAEYSWSGGGPYMLQEQVAQFLGIKSFKRKYPNIQRRVVDMQERDFIRESGLAGEAMCDLGLTAVNSSDILDIMYSDFQDKYEEYCKHQRDRQAKDLINKQRALTLAASQEKAKMDITQQAVQSAANWNATFNKTRRDQRKSCMDLQTLTIHFPKGKMKQISKPKIGYYPVALVPGQFTDYYREFTPTEINNLPLNTVCYNTIVRESHHEMECDSQTDGSGSESDSSTSDSDSSYSGSSDGEDCTLCKPTPKRIAAAQ